MIHRVCLLVILGTLIVSACGPQALTTANGQSIGLQDCVLSAPRVEEQIDAKCGSLAVAEDRSNPQGRTLTLNIAVVPSIKRNPEPDPLFILVGGPGQSAVETYPLMAPTLFGIHEERDIVLVDQRGTGKSNPLRCLDPEDETLEDDQIVPLLKTCPDKLDADLRFYTTDIAMQDLDQVRSALGYNQINLYGVSYGTRAALVYLKMYPEHVRSAVLDAVVDPAFVLYQDVAEDGQKSLESFFARCEADAACNNAFPALKSEFEEVLRSVEEKPVDITIPHPVTGRPTDLTVTSIFLSNIIFNTLYAPDLVAMLPLAIHQAYEADNYAPLITQAFLLDAGIYDGMLYAVACAEDAPLITLPENTSGIFGDGAKLFVEVCKAWPHVDPPTVVHEPVSSDVPVLMLSGEADPITPPWHAQQLATSLRNSLHLIFKNMGHGNSESNCASKILDKFFETASVQDLDTSCTKDIEPPPFFVDFSGPQP